MRRKKYSTITATGKVKPMPKYTTLFGRKYKTDRAAWRTVQAVEKKEFAASRSRMKSRGRKTDGNKSMARRRRKTRTVTRYVRATRRRARRGAGGAKTMLNKAARGAGYALLAGVALNQFAPQFAQLGKLGAAWYGGGIYGVGAQILLDGGLNGLNLGGLLGGTTAQSGGAASF